jgi:hypothetical protein
MLDFGLRGGISKLADPLLPKLNPLAPLEGKRLHLLR